MKERYQNLYNIFLIIKQGHAYKFGYDITDPYGAKNSRKESDDGYGNRVNNIIVI